MWLTASRGSSARCPVNTTPTSSGRWSGGGSAGPSRACCTDLRAPAKRSSSCRLRKKSQRDVFKVEYSKLMDTYVSETEHNLRNVFLLYRYAAAVLSTPPILLLNEADTFISTRVSVRQANDKFENEFQGMFLEELEQFEGILVAPTNRTQDIDDAYDRRFLIKLKIDSPDGKTRFSIWKNRMPELKKGEAQSLSEKYHLTGAEIENVITQFDVMSAIDDTPPGIADLEKICAGVEAGTIGQKRRPAGYKIS